MDIKDIVNISPQIMEKRRRFWKQQTKIKIAEAENILNRSMDTIKNIKQSTYNKEYIEKKIEDLNNLIQEKKVLLEQLQNDYENVDMGIFDDIINAEYKEQEINKNKTDKKQKFRGIKDTNNVSFIKQDYIQSDESKEKMYDNSYKYYNSVVNSIPDYIKNNLKDMPNNKGYIFRGMWIYGELPDIKGEPIVLFEKNREKMVIHEFSYNNKGFRWYKKFEKYPQDKRNKLILSEYKPIKNIFSNNKYITV